MNPRPVLSTTQRAGANALTALLLCLGACRKEAPDPGPPGMVDNTGQPIVAAPPVAPPRPVEPPPEPPTVYDFERQQPVDPGALSAKLPPSGLAPGTALNAPSTADAGPPRDLASELSAALTPVTNCVDAAQAAAQPEGRLTISVSAYVQASGRVSRTTVTAPGQPQAALDCMQKQVLALSLRPPIADAPTQVNASTQLQVRTAAGTGATTGGNAVRPQRMNPDIAQPEPGEVAGAPE